MSSPSAEVRSSELAHHFADLGQQTDAARLGMWIFLATEVMFFGGVLMAFAIYRTQHLPEFRAGCEHGRCRRQRAQALFRKPRHARHRGKIHHAYFGRRQRSA